MGQGFQSFKRRLIGGAFLRSAVFGISLGIIAFALQWLVCKLTNQPVELTIYTLTSAVVALLGGGIALVLLFPTDRRIAKKLDRALSLGEKVQTMLAFRNDPGEMAALQRLDTDRRLLEAPKRKVKGACTWLFALLPAVACLCLVGTILVPAKEAPEPPAVDHAFSMTPWQEQALRDLIEEVKTSAMEEEPKDDVVKQLESLLIKLKTVRKESVMKETVISTVEKIHEAVSDYNTYDLLADALQSSAGEQIRGLGDAVRSLESLLVGEWIHTVLEAVQADPSQAASLAAGIRQALLTSRAAEGDPIRMALQQISDDVSSIAEHTPKEELAAIFDRSEILLNAVLHVQAVNEDVEEDTIYTLLSIFGIKASEVPEHVFNDPDDPRGEGDYDPDDDMDKIHSGGIGSGEMIFGSDDTVYDPETGAFVPYGTVIDRYYARISELLVDGRLTPEMEKAISDYFAILFDGSEQKSEITEREQT